MDYDSDQLNTAKNRHKGNLNLKSGFQQKVPHTGKLRTLRVNFVTEH